MHVWYRSGAMARDQVWLGTTQGLCDYAVDKSMPREDFDELDAAVKRADPTQVGQCLACPRQSL